MRSEALQCIGELFNSSYDFYLWMVLLRGDEFKNRITALQRDVLTDPLSSDWTIYERTKQVLQVHDSGLIFLTINRAQLRQNGDTLAIDWEKERKRERWIVIHRKSIGIPRGLPSHRCSVLHY